LDFDGAKFSEQLVVSVGAEIDRGYSCRAVDPGRDGWEFWKQGDAGVHFGALEHPLFKELQLGDRGLGFVSRGHVIIAGAGDHFEQATFGGLGDVESRPVFAAAKEFIRGEYGEFSGSFSAVMAASAIGSQEGSDGG
jgi:hypothetical protein